MEIIVYSSNHCGYCIKQKEFLLEKGIVYEERDINIKENYQELKELGGRGTPFTVIKEAGKIVSTVVGFNKEELSKILN